MYALIAVTHDSLGVSGAYRSVDGAATWSPYWLGLPTGIPLVSMVCDPLTGALFIATWRGVYSDRFGVLNDGLTCPHMTAIAVSDSARRLYCATRGGGAFRMDLPSPVTAVGDRANAAIGPAAAGPRFVSVSPNPANPSVAITYRVPESGGEITLEIHDLRGALVRVLDRGERAAGEWTVRWDGRDRAGRPAASGVYLVRLSGEGRVATRKLLLVR